MNPVYQDASIAIFDDVLSPELFASLSEYCEEAEFHSVHRSGRQPVWRLEDGDPLTSKGVVWPSVPLDDLLPSNISIDRMGARLYPTGTALDPVLRAVKEHGHGVPNLIGTEGDDWAGISAALFVYPVGTGISWHHDSGPYSGAFIYYAHREWNIQWGGELLVADHLDGPALVPPERVRNLFDNRAQNSELQRAGTGRFVMPKPNRLVILRGGIWHQIARVAPSAGNHARLSLAGFFVTPEGASFIAQEQAALLGLADQTR